MSTHTFFLLVSIKKRYFRMNPGMNWFVCKKKLVQNATIFFSIFLELSVKAISDYDFFFEDGARWKLRHLIYPYISNMRWLSVSQKKSLYQEKKWSGTWADFFFVQSHSISELFTFCVIFFYEHLFAPKKSDNLFCFFAWKITPALVICLIAFFPSHSHLQKCLSLSSQLRRKRCQIKAQPNFYNA